MRPTDCPRCQQEFLRRPLLQAEARHTALTIGVRTAQADLDEALDEYHVGHSNRAPAASSTGEAVDGR